MGLLNDKAGISKKIPVLIGVIVLTLWGLNGLYLWNEPEKGVYGDMFGAVNALFSGLAFAGVIYAILLQSKELECQRDELRLTRTEIEGQKLELKAQNETLRKQNFENTFFQLLSLLNEITSSLQITDANGTGVKTTGRSCFKWHYQHLT